MDNNLTTTGSSQSQSTTGNPQSNAQSLITGTQSSTLQPGTSASLLNPGGVSLDGSSLSTVSLAPSTPAASTNTQTAATVATPKHHTNPVLLGSAIVLFLLAIALFWLTSRPVKSTT